MAPPEGGGRAWGGIASSVTPDSGLKPLKSLNRRHESHLVFVAPDLDSVAPDSVFVAVDLASVALDLDFIVLTLGFRFPGIESPRPAARLADHASLAGARRTAAGSRETFADHFLALRPQRLGAFGIERIGLDPGPLDGIGLDLRHMAILAIVAPDLVRLGDRGRPHGRRCALRDGLEPEVR